jgi:hypothetical protein
MLELWRYQYRYQGRWYEGYIVSQDGLTREKVKALMADRLTSDCADLRMFRTHHIARVIMSGLSKRVPKSYVLDEPKEE